jgi:dienelactone hydrolase
MSSDQSSSSDPAAQQRLQAVLAGRYRVVREVGAGGMATVYLAEDLRHGRKVAVKVLRPELASTVGPARFLREIDVAAQLNHPNILSLLDSGSENGIMYYVMPYIDGASLRERLASGQMPVAEAVRILREVVDALAEAHRRGIVHRDIKPDNVMISGRHALVTDFGVARAVGDPSSKPLTTIGIALGTPAYMAPEQAMADPSVDHRVDIYALGVMAYEMLTGSLPFTGNMQAVFAAHLSEPPPSLRASRPEIPVPLEAAVLKCLAKAPDDRWQTADELLTQLEAIETPGSGVAPTARPATPWPRRHWRSVLASIIVVVALGGLAMPRLLAAKRARWVRTEAIPAIERHTDAGEWEQAYRVANRAEEVAPSDSALDRVWPTFSYLVRIETEPSGATIWRKAYADTAGPWLQVGVSPVTVRYPYDPSRLRIELSGHRPLMLAVGASFADTVLNFRLDTPETLPEQMVRVERGPAPLLPGVVLNEFLLDKFEVTNEQFKIFVDSGGYQRRDLWQHPFEKDGAQLAWEEGIRLLVDRTGRPGPSTWELSGFPAGQERYPVSGVSWYEAAAYARFAGKDLPTIHHWRRAYAGGNSAWTIPASNVEGDGPAPVGQYQGLTRFGALDMAGNVREWCYNVSDGKRVLIGGGWNDPDYMMARPYPQDAFDRSPTNGIRLAKYFAGDSTLALTRQPLQNEALPDFTRVKPVPDDIFEVYRRQYAYDRTALNATLESIDTAKHWYRERITFDAAYGGERVVLYLYLPKTGQPPFQTVVYWPGSAATGQRSIDQWRTMHLDFAIKSGRAFAFPIYKGTFERRDGTRDAVNLTTAYRDRVLQWSKDLGRSIDYLTTRVDVDTAKLAFYGYSWGGRIASVMLPNEPRFKTAVLYVAGISRQRALPEADELSFVHRVTLPVLMLSGRFDQTFLLETQARPMFQLLGTPVEHKRHVISAGGHFVPRAEFIRETLDWLDRYLGPVR